MYKTIQRICANVDAHPKCHFEPFLTECISGSRCFPAFFRESGASMIVASTIVPPFTCLPSAFNTSCTWSKKVFCRPWVCRSFRNLHKVVASGTWAPLQSSAPGRTSWRSCRIWHPLPLHRRDGTIPAASAYAASPLSPAGAGRAFHPGKRGAPIPPIPSMQDGIHLR